MEHPPERAGKMRSTVLAWVGLGALVLVVAATFQDYGITWDEPTQRNFAHSVWRFYETGGRDRVATESDIRFYGGLFELAATLSERVLPFGVYEDRHLANALFGLLGILFTFQLGRLLGGVAAGLASATLLTLAPVYYGHMFANSKDVPLAALYVVALAAIVKLYQVWPTARWRHLLGVGATIGLAAAVRVGALVLLGVLVFAVSLRIAVDWFATKRRPWDRDVPRSLVRLASAPAIAWVVMCVFWPFALVSPLAHPVEALRVFAHYSWSGNVLLGGQLIDAHHLPWSYLPHWFLVTMADVALAALGLVLLAAVLGRLRPLSGWLRGELVVILVASLVPPLALAVNHATLYDGMRHVLFIVPPLMAVLGHLLVAAARGARHRVERFAAGGVLGLAALVTVVDMVRLHPYQMVYFNRLVAGGLRGAAGRYDTDYWGTSLKEATEWVIANVPNVTQDPLRVGNNCSEDLTGYYIEKDRHARRRFVNVNLDEVNRGAVDIYLGITRDHRHEKLPGRVLHRVERDGVPLAYVVAVDSPAPPLGTAGAGSQ